MPANYVLIGEFTTNATTTSVTLNNIPQTSYTDLKLVWSARLASGAGFALLDFNGLSTANFSNRVLEGTGSSAISFVSGNTNYAGGLVGAGDTANTFTNSELYIPNAFGSTAKSYSIDAVTENNGTTAYADMVAGLWNNSAAITSIRLSTSSGAGFAAGSSFSLYGIAALGTTPTVLPKASGGDIIVNDGTYWYHAFLSSGLFTPSQALSCDYLVVAGGGAGGSSNAGGGGGGGLRSTVTATGGGGSLESAIAVTSGTIYPIIVGAGGVGANEARGGSGNNSVFATITSQGGAGGGGANSSQPPIQGGSGGGGTQTGAGSAGTTNQGFAGGSAGVNFNNGGGGGGAGQLGGTAGTNGGTGGNGVEISAFATPTNTGVSNFYAGGGGGSSFSGSQGAGGAGGGTAGQYDGALSASANTGGGAGGRNRPNGPAGNGGSGIVIIRYTMA